MFSLAAGLEFDMFWLTIIPAILGMLYLYLIHRFKYWERKNVIQKLPLTPFGDNADILIKGCSFNEMVRNTYHRFEGVRYTGIYLFCNPVLMLRDPELIKELCVKDFDHFIDHKPFQSEYADPLWNKNLFALKGELWKHMRSTLNPAFTGSKLRQMFVSAQECAETFVEYFLQRMEEFQEVELKDNFARYTNDVIVNTAFGIKCNSLSEPENEFYIRGTQTADFSGFFKNLMFQLTRMIPPLGKVFKVSLFDQNTSAFIKKIIKEILSYREKNLIQRTNMISLLMEAAKRTIQEGKKSNFSHDDITAQALIFFFSAFDTVCSTLCYMAYELAANPDVQQKLIAELDEFKATNKPLTYEALSNLTYLDMVLTETMRRWPHLVVADRLCVKPYTIEAKHPHEKPVHLTKGDVLWVPLYALHHDPKYWKNPEKFDPERFAPENKDKIVPYSYLPFGVGPRRCIAGRFAILEMKLVFYELLCRFEIVPSSRSCIPMVPGRTPFTLSSSKGFWLGLRKRRVNKDVLV